MHRAGSRSGRRAWHTSSWVLRPAASAGEGGLYLSDVPPGKYLNGLRRALLLTIALGCGLAPAPAGAQSALELQDCRLDRVSVPARCGILAVFEDRASGAGWTIELEIVVVPAVSDSPDPDPLFFLAGGPGQAATELAGPLARLLARVRRTRDLVFVDQRGTGGADEMRCAFFEGASDGDRSSESFQVGNLPLERVRECLDEIATDADPRHYTTPVAMDDLDEVRAALGYETINLLGGSYGTRAGLVYMRRHPDRVRTAVLDGLAPVAMRLPSNMSVDAHDALDRLFADCEADAGCRDAFPDLSRTFAGVIAELEASPRALAATHPRTGEPFESTLTASRFAADVRAVLYYPTLASLLPWTIARAAAGDFAPYLAQSVPLNEFGGMLNAAVFLSVICAEDVSRLNAAEAARVAGGGVLGRESMVAWVAACTVWPAAGLPSGYFEPVRSDAPTLLLSGALDPVTPPRWGEEVLRGLGNAQHVVAPGAGHGVLVRGCTADVIARFIDAGSHADLDVSCIEAIRRPPFMLSPAGTEP